MSLRRADHSSKEVLPSVVCVFSKPQQRGGPGPLGLSSHEKKNILAYCHVVLQMRMPNEQGRFEIAQSMRLQGPRCSGGPLKDWLFADLFFAKHVMYISSGCSVNSGKGVGNTNKFVFALAPEIS
jgi:hypothetical protein